MKFLIPALALVATVSMPAFAQEAPDATSARPSTQQMEAMQKLHEQMRQLHDQARLQMLGSLSPAHRTAIANIIGQLAIAPNPDRRAAAAQIDTLLSNGEKQSIIAAEENERTNSRSMMESARAQFEASATPEEREKMQARDQERAARMSQRQNRPQRTPDAGMTLLRIAGGGPAGPGGPGGPGEMGAHRDAADFGRGGPPPGAPN